MGLEEVREVLLKEGKVLTMGIKTIRKLNENTWICMKQDKNGSINL